MNTKWQELVARFQKLSTITGADKSSSYTVSIHYTLFDGVMIEMGTYDISNWPRMTIIEAKDEGEALRLVEKKIKQAEEIVLIDYQIGQ